MNAAFQANELEYVLKKVRVDTEVLLHGVVLLYTYVVFLQLPACYIGNRHEHDKHGSPVGWL